MLVLRAKMVAFLGAQGVLDPSSCPLLLCLNSVVYAVVTAAVRREENIKLEHQLWGYYQKPSWASCIFRSVKHPLGADRHFVPHPPAAKLPLCSGPLGVIKDNFWFSGLVDLRDFAHQWMRTHEDLDWHLSWASMMGLVENRLNLKGMDNLKSGGPKSSWIDQSRAQSCVGFRFRSYRLVGEIKIGNMSQ